ncbi:MAG: hypothetical protein IKX92_04600 [Clostridia bacterium]|nr:hypothetical protein [Clostridia bacterium]
MDYQGNYFPEDEDERSSVTYKRVKGVIKWTMYGISFVVYALLFYFIFVNRDRALLEENYMHTVPGYTDMNVAEISLLRINPREFMNDDGSLQVYNVDYAPDRGLIEMGIRFNANKLTDGERGDVLEYRLEDSDGNEYKLVNKKTDSGGRYGFARICFEGLSIDLSSNDLEVEKLLSPDAKEAADGDSRSYREYLDDMVKDYPRNTYCKYTLSVYYVRESEKVLLHTFMIYDNQAVFYKTDYNKG